jgi:hypothetical protein
MHKGKLDFEIYENLNSPFSKILIDLWIFKWIYDN